MITSINEPGTPAFEEVSGATKPVITGLAPDTCAIGDADFTLIVSGTGFTKDTVIYFAGHDEPTTYIDVDGSVSTGVKPSLWGSPAVVQVGVHNGTLASNLVNFTFTEAGGATRSSGKKKAALVLSELEPAHTQVGTSQADFHLRVIGEGFDDTCSIVFDDEELPTRCETSKTLIAWAPMAKTPGEVDVEVARGDELTEVLIFEFTDKGGRKGKTERKQPKATPANQRTKKR